MRQAVLLSREELEAMKTGTMVEITVGGQAIAIGIDPAHRKRPRSAAQNAATDKARKARWAKAQKKAGKGVRISKATGKPVRPYNRKKKGGK